jgi:hypothetical protein
VHDDGVVVPELDRIYTRQLRHDPRDLDAARRLAEPTDVDPARRLLPRRVAAALRGAARRTRRSTTDEKIQLLNEELDRYAV